jgi:LAO/AO transport system kinase
MELAQKVLRGDERSAARLISLIEEGKEEGYEAISHIYPYIGKSQVIGVTGAPGSGKSTLIDRLARSYSARGKRVGILAIDPTSPRGGGALLGDRIRMGGAEKIEGVFIRSMAHRGYPGGIARAAMGATYVLEALGKEKIIVESVGVGQTELQIALLCDTVLTVLTPDYGDEIQLMKAGLLEIGNVAVVNKKDKSGAEDLAFEIRMLLGSRKKEDWQIPVVTVQAISGEGVDELLRALDGYESYLCNEPAGKERRKERLLNCMLGLLKEESWTILLKRWSGDEAYRKAVTALQDGAIDPYKAMRMIISMMEGEGWVPKGGGPHPAGKGDGKTDRNS